MKVDEAGLRIRPWGLGKTLDGLEDLNEDVVFLVRRAAYIDEIRSVAIRARRVGWVVLFAGLSMLAWAALRGPGVHSPAAYYAEAAIVLGWALFVYVMIQRTRYVRAHPFDPSNG